MGQPTTEKFLLIEQRVLQLADHLKWRKHNTNFLLDPVLQAAVRQLVTDVLAADATYGYPAGSNVLMLKQGVRTTVGTITGTGTGLTPTSIVGGVMTAGVLS